jgi:hypothetical protein
VGDLHSVTGWVAIGWTALVGFWGVGASIRKTAVGPWFALATIGGLAFTAVQVGLGLWLFARGIDPGSFHLFYGIVILFMVAFAYIFRAQLAVDPGLRWGLLLLFVAGLGLRAWATFGDGIG